jgi:outer membrane protein OmpA-like peptidoglycan-associated protein
MVPSALEGKLMRILITSTSLMVAAAVAVTGCGGTQVLEEETTVSVSASPPPPPPPEPEPEPEPERVQVTRERIEVNDTIHFELDSATIREDSYELLEEIARVINNHPEVLSISIEGHTDSIGEAAYNQRLSERRAASVMRFLVERGNVDAERLKSKGFGLENPIADNATREGRAQNRRVEFRILERDLEQARMVPVEDPSEADGSDDEVPDDEVSADEASADETED